MSILIIFNEVGIRENINLNTVQRELGKSVLTFDDVLDYLEKTKSVIKELSRNGDLIFRYVNTDGQLVPLSKRDNVRSYSEYTTFYISNREYDSARRIEPFEEVDRGTQRETSTISHPGRRFFEYGIIGAAIGIILRGVLTGVGHFDDWLFRYYNWNGTFRFSVNEVMVDKTSPLIMIPVFVCLTASLYLVYRIVKK